MVDTTQTDDTTFIEYEDGTVEWQDESGAHGAFTGGGATIENPDGSMTALDTSTGWEASWDEQGNETEQYVGPSVDLGDVDEWPEQGG